MKYRYALVILLITLFACTSNQNKGKKVKISTNEETVSLKYAKGFNISKSDDYKIITVINPWPGANNVEYKYLLVNRDTKLPDFADEYTVIRTPVENVICLSTTHVALIDILNKTETITGVSGSDYINNKKVREKIENKLVFDVGYDSNLNYELIAGLNPDLVITYGVGGEIAGYNQRLKDLGINAVMNSEYLETDPLGKLEWIKFIAAFYNMDDEANAYFNAVEKKYNDLLEIVKGIEKKPTVLVGLPYKDSWFVPGGNSFLAKMIQDAGGNYIWKNNDSRKSMPYNTESIFVQARNAEIWINTGTANTKKDILKNDERFNNFIPFKKSRIFNNNLRTNQYGGNDYWESGLVHPDIVLKDMIKIFHPELLKDYQPVYYKQIN